MSEDITPPDSEEQPSSDEAADAGVARGNFTQRLAMASARRPWLTIGLWLAALVAAGAIYFLWGDVFTSSMTFLNNPDSKMAANLIESHGGGSAAEQTSAAVSSLADGITRANKGAGSLAKGSKKLSTGATRLKKGLKGLAKGAGQVSSGQRKTSAGASALSQGLSSASRGASSLSSGIGRVNGATGSLSSGLSRLSSASSQLTNGAMGVKSGAQQVATGARRTASGARQASSSASQLKQAAGSLDSLISAYAQAHPEAAQDATYQQIMGLSGGVASGASGLSSGLRTLSSGAGQVANGASRVSSGTSRVASGSRQLRDGIRKTASGARQLDRGMDRLASGSAALASGVNSAARGSQQLASGARSLAGGTDQLASGARSAAKGAGKVASGTRDLSAGAKKLESGLSSASSGAKKLDESMSTVGSLEDRDTEVIVVRSDTLKTTDPAFRAFVVDLRERLKALPETTVSSVLTVYDDKLTQEAREALVSDDGHSTLISVTMGVPSSEALNHISALIDVAKAANGKNGFKAAITGPATFGRDASDLAERDLLRGETIGIPVALLVLVLVFGALVAAGLPLILSLFSIVIGAALAILLGQLFDISVFALNILSACGLAVGIDYSLFIVSRYREEFRAGRSRIEALSVAAGTASNAVFFSGMTVVFALGGLFIVPLSIFTSLGVGAMVAVFVAVSAALTLLPAVLMLLGDRVDALPVPFLYRYMQKGHGRWWARAAQITMRRPAISLAVGVIILLALTAPALGMRTGGFGASTFPESYMSRQGLEMLQRDFSAGMSQPIDVVIDGDLGDKAVQQPLTDFINDMHKKDGRYSLAGVKTSADGTLAVVSLTQDAEANSDPARDAVRELRSKVIPDYFGDAPAHVYVGGATANDIDVVHTIDTFMPIVIAVVLTLSFILLLVAFRSIPVAITAIIMNLLSVGAAYGALTLLFQDGLGSRLLWLTKAETIESWVPLLMFCILFGLSMDYQVFLLSRIRERWSQTGDSYESVVFGVRTTASIITGAALIMVVVFIGMGSGDLVVLQQFGWGLAIAVLVDAFIVRVVVAPAMIALIGDRYWWLPRWLEWLPRIDIEGPSEDTKSARPTKRIEEAGADAS